MRMKESAMDAIRQEESQCECGPLADNPDLDGRIY